MGLDFNGTRFLLLAKATGVDFAKSATVGRQSLYLDPGELKKNLHDFGIRKADSEIAALLESAQGYAEPFLRMLGAEEIVSVDLSTYEGAAVVHDMNFPVADHLKDRFDAVIDGGALEHIFNFPMAIKNCMEMVRAGGHFLSITPANNFLGHGFYQFSPDLFFRIFTEANGFALQRVLLFEANSKGIWYLVSDPEKIRRRVELVNNAPSYLLIQAKKTGRVSHIFEAPPQQSFYVELWSEPDAANREVRPSLGGKIRNAIKRFIPQSVLEIYWRASHSSSRLSNPDFFKRVDALDLVKT